MPATLPEHLDELDDPRTGNATQHKFLDILMVAVCATLSGADGWTDVETYGQAKEDFLDQFLDLPNGIPSHDTFGRVFRHLDAEAFAEMFTRWVSQQEEVEGDIIAIDGKALRGSYDRAAARPALTVVNAWAREARLVLGQIAAREGSNEIGAIPKLLELLTLEGNTITIDAIGCQKDFASTITQQGGDYVLALKGNQEGLYEETTEHFEALAEEEDLSAWSYLETADQDHGRQEQRRYYMSDDLSAFTRTVMWKGMRSVAMVESERTVGGKTSYERRYYISSLPAEAERLERAVRGHWHVENRLHWRLDVAFQEDACRVRKGEGAANFGVLRRIAANLLEQERSADLSMRRKRLQAGWDDSYLERLLSF